MREESDSDAHWTPGTAGARLGDCQGDISDTGLGQDGSRLLQIDRG